MGCPRGNSGLSGGYCHGACQLLGLDPWRHLECGRKECGVTPSGRMECGVSPSGRRISLKGAVAQFFLSFFLSSFFLPHATTCLSPFSNRSILPQPLFSCPVSAAAARRSCPCCVSAAAARCPCPVRSFPRPPPHAVPVLSDPVLGCHRAPFLSCLILSSAAAAHRPRPCPATKSPVGPAVTIHDTTRCSPSIAITNTDKLDNLKTFESTGNEKKLAQSLTSSNAILWLLV